MCTLGRKVYARIVIIIIIIIAVDDFFVVIIDRSEKRNVLY